MRLTLIFLVLAAVVVQDALSLRFRPPPKQKNVDVSKLCDLKKCGKGKACRVIKSTTGYRRKRSKYLALCVPCVPKGVDSMCNALGFARALLMADKCSGVQVKTIRKWNKNKGRKARKNRQKRRNKKDKRGGKRYSEKKIYIVDERSTEPQYCHLSSGKGKVGCPKGAKCVSYARYDFSGIGVCCYGPGKIPRQAVKNDDKVCGLCKKECGKRESCQEDVSKGGRKKYTCQPRQYPGCPRTPYDCRRMTESKAKACQTRNDCGSSMACCPTSCSIDSFVCAPMILY